MAGYPCCVVGCRICSPGKTPEYILITMANWIDLVCAAFSADCPSAPSPLSQCSILNDTFQLDYVPGYAQTVLGLDTCYTWYESGPIAYPDFLGGGSGAGCPVISGGSIIFGLLVRGDLAGGIRYVSLYSYDGALTVGPPVEDRQFILVQNSNEAVDAAWLCVGGTSGTVTIPNPLGSASTISAVVGDVQSLYHAIQRFGADTVCPGSTPDVDLTFEASATLVDI
jgi:hypothetical protein